MKKIQISPSILSADFSQLGNEIQRLEKAGADMIHVDVMDGHFVPNLTIGPPVIKNLRKYTKLPFDVHLMIKPVHKYIKDYAEAGANIITIHPEATDSLKDSIKHIKELGKKVGVSLNPETKIDSAKEFLSEIDLILIMSVHPGFGGQKFIPDVIDKIKELKNIKSQKNLKFDIEVDGGIDFNNSKIVIDAGANILASGTKVEKLEELKAKFVDIKILKFDISQTDKIEEFIDNATDKLGGPLNCIVNNAGVTQDNLAIRMSLDEWTKVIDINLNSTFLMCKYAIKKMLKKKYGKIINITSIVGHTGNLGQANYSASKAGIVAFSKSLAIEYAKKNININCVSPGFIKTEMTDKIDEEFKKVLISKIPSGSLGSGEDVSNCVVFLASDMANYINGETIHVNGGMYMA